MVNEVLEHIWLTLTLAYLYIEYAIHAALGSQLELPESDRQQESMTYSFHILHFALEKFMRL